MFGAVAKPTATASNVTFPHWKWLQFRDGSGILVQKGDELLITNMDFAILDFIAEYLRCGVLDFFLPLVTHLGDGGWFWIVLTLVLLIPKSTRKYGGAMALALIFDLLLCNITIKPLVGRVRPYDLRQGMELMITAPHDYSFPSGHTAASFAGSGALYFMKAKGRIPALILATVIGFSRLYLFVHYPTDVVCGAILGLICGFLGAYFARKIPVLEKNQ